MIEVKILPEKVLRYLNDDFETLDLNTYCDLNNILDKPRAVVVKAPYEFEAPVQLTLTDLNDVTFRRVYTIEKGGAALVKNLYPARIYRCRFRSCDGSEKVEEFCTQDKLPCMLDVDGLRNVRDFGGWKASGGKLKYKVLYRGSELNRVANHGIELTEEGRRVMAEEMHIITDIDLRNDKESLYITESPIGGHVKYYRKMVLGYMDMFKEEFNGTLKEIFEILSYRENYPVYIHCWAGADRTGTLLAVLKAALGVSYEDITRDHEVSTFSIFGVRGRCAKEFTYEEVFEHLKTEYPAATLEESAKRYLFEKVKISEETFSDIRSILIDEITLSNNFRFKEKFSAQ